MASTVLSTEHVLDRAAHIQQANSRMLRSLRDLREKDALLRRQLLEDYIPTLQRQYDAEDESRQALVATELQREQREQTTLGIQAVIVPVGRPSGTSNRSGSAPGAGQHQHLTAAMELRHVMRDHQLLLRELDLKHQKASRRLTADL